MEEAPAFDLHAAESAAQIAAMWLVLEKLVRQQLRYAPRCERSEFLDDLLEAADTIILPEGQQVALEWIAHRYWSLIDNFAKKCKDM